MALNTINPAISDATQDSYGPSGWTDPNNYPSEVAKRIDHKFKLGPVASELMALWAATLGDKNYRHTFTCVSGDSVGDAVYLSSADTIAGADASTAAKSKVLGWIRDKPSATSCYVQHFYLATGSGLTAGAVVYLQDDGSIGAATGTITRPIGIAVSTTKALCVSPELFENVVVAGSIESKRDTIVSLLSGRYAELIHRHSAADIVRGTFPDSTISESSVTQHAAAIPASSIISTRTLL